MNKKLLAALLAATMVASLASCGAKSEGSNEETTSEGAALKYWTAPFGEDDKTFFENNLASWQEETGNTVEVQVYSWDDYEEKIMTGVASGTGPDVVYMYNEMLYNYIDQGAIEPLDDYFTDEEKANYIYWNNGQILGKQYILPYVVGAPRILYANMDILADAGIDEIPTTWDGLIETSKTIKEKTGITGFDQPWGGYFGDLNELYYPYLWQAGGDLVDADGKLLLDTPEALEAAQFLLRLKDEGVIDPSATGRDASAVNDDFKAGKIAMTIMNTTASGKLDEAGINWGFVPFTTNKEGGTFVANDSLVLMSACQNKEAGVSLMKALTAPEIMEAFHLECYSMPPITTGEKYVDNEKFESMYTECADEFHALPIMANSSQIMTSLYSNLQEMMMGEKTPEEALQATMDYAETL